MKNTIYQLHDTDSVLEPNPHKIEFYCCQTNEIEPLRDVMELGIVITGKDSTGEHLQIDFSADEEELEELMEYLRNLQRYISKFNKESKPKEQ